MVENGKDSGFYFFLFLFNNLEGGLSTLGMLRFITKVQNHILSNVNTAKERSRPRYSLILTLPFIPGSPRLEWVRSVKYTLRIPYKTSR